MQIGEMKGYWYDRAQVAVYMCTETDSTGNCAQQEATQDQKDLVQAQLESSTLAPFIKKFEFESHDQAFANFQDQFSDSPITGFVTKDMLPESFRVNLIDPNQADILIESLSSSAGVQDVQDQRRYLDQIFAVLNAASFTAIGLATLMLIAAVLLIATTIRLSAFSRRRELGIMRLVGASNRFIQTPFILEGVFAALIGSLFFVKGYLAETLATTTTLVGLDEAIIVVPILIVVGGVLAAASAGFAISRYLKV
jgi:cell division transport system permease protein